MVKKYKCRVEYLESTGTQYLDTGVIAKTGLTVEARIKYISNTGIFCGAITTTAGNGDRYYAINFSQSNKVAFTYLDSDFSASTNLTAGNYYTIKTVLGATKQEMFVNGVSSGSTSKTDNVNLNWTLGLFGLHRGGTFNPEWYSLCSATVYYVKIWDNENLVRDFIPVLDNSGRPALYDQVSETLFYNQGSGDDFSYGRQIIPVEYLESTGTQYIDTGYAFTDDFSWEIDFEGISDGTTLFGGRTSSTRTALLYQRNYGGIDLTTCPIAGYNGQETPFQLEDLRVGRHKIKMSVSSNKGSVWVDGTQVYNEQAFTGSYISGTTQALFADKFGNNDYREQTSSKVYGLKMWQGSTLVRDFIPCIDENLNPFMFDKIHNTVYLNAGTGQFKVSPYKADNLNKKLLRKKLALMLANLKKKRKYYCEVEYLESTGTQWINAGINVNTSTDEIKLYFELTETQNYKWFFGEYDNNARLGLGSGDGVNKRNFLYQQSATKVSDAQTYNAQHLFEINSNGGFLDGTKIRDYLSFASTSNIYLFNLNIDSPSDYRCKSKIWRYEHKRNGVLVRDLIPVLDWDMTPCMYDNVSGQFFYNQGTGDFVAGREIHPVDYLESTGVEYIDTGIKFDGANTKIELKTYEDSLTRRHSVCGDDGNFFYYFRGTGNWAIGYNGTASNIDTYMSVGNNVFVMDKNNVYVNGVLAKTYTASSAVSSYNALLFNRKTSLVDNGAVTMYYCKIWNNNSLVRDYIPAIDENGVGYMFDRVSHTCFLNQGTGAFLYPAREVEYLQSDGARAIVAGVTVDDTCGYDVKWMALNSNDTIILGTKGSGDSRWVLSGSNNPNVNLSWNTSSGGIGLGLNKIQTAQMNYFNDRQRILNDTPLTDITTALSANASTYSVGIFGGYWGASQISLYSTCRIYYAKISKGTELIRDFIPMFKDGSPCLFDKIGGLYYFGTGTGTFTAGKIKEPEYE